MVRPVRHFTTCPHDCPSTCALEVERLDEYTIGKVYGAKDQPYTAGVICAKVSRYAERVHHPDRLTRALIRTGPKGMGRAAFEETDWDTALNTVVNRFTEVMEQYGPQAVWPYHYAGTMGLVQRDSIECFRNLFGFSRQKSTFCVTLADAGWIAGAGVKCGVDPREIAETDVLVVWGGNPVNTQVNVMHQFSKARKQRGARLVVIDPYRTGTAEKADLHLMLRPGTDGALACAVIHVLLRDGLADRDYLERMTDFDTDAERHFQSRSPEWAAEVTGLSKEQIEQFAALYGSTQKTFIRAGYGFTRSRNGSVNMHAVACLPAVTGAWRIRGGGAVYGLNHATSPNQDLIVGADILDPAARVLDQSRIGPVLCGDPSDLQGGPPVMAMLMQNTNPVLVAPDSARVRQGLNRDDLFLCVHEQFFTETAAYADVVLPATMFVEHDDFYMASGHTFLQLGRQVIQPPGDCRSNHNLLRELAHNLGRDHASYTQDALTLIDRSLKDTGYNGLSDFSEENWVDRSLGEDRMHFRHGFGHADGRFRFYPDWKTFDHYDPTLPILPDHYDIIDQPDEDRPFRLVTAPARWFLNTSFTESDNSLTRMGEPQALLHPDDLARLGLQPGQGIRMGNALGEVVLNCRSFDGLQPGVVIVESIWPSRHFGNGNGINTLVSAEIPPPDGGAVYHDTSVWIRATS